MSPTNLEFDRLLREFGYDVHSHSVCNDAILRAQGRDLPEVSAFGDAVQEEIAATRTPFAIGESRPRSNTIRTEYPR